jgi:hypothetical protein
MRGGEITVVNVGASGTVIVDTTGADTINGSGTYTLATQYAAVTVESLGGAPGWVISTGGGGGGAPAAHASTHANGGTDAVSLSGAQITSGTIATLRLASTGTASSATYLRGDQSWSSPTTVANDTLWDAAGDLAVGSGADTAAKLSKGNQTQALVVGASTLEWGTNHFSGGSFVTGTVANTIAETLPGATPFGAVSAPTTTGVAHLHGVYLPKGAVVTNLTVVSGATAAGTPTNQWFALCNDSRQTLRYTVNDTTAAWNANTPKTLGLTSTYTTTYSGLHYIAVVVTATTMPPFRGINVNAGTMTGINGQSFASSTGLTTPAAFGPEGTAFAAATSRIQIVMGIVS